MFVFNAKGGELVAVDLVERNAAEVWWQWNTSPSEMRVSIYVVCFAKLTA